MSFAAEVKTELCRADTGPRHCAVAECLGILLYGNTFMIDEIKIITGSESFAQRLPKLFKRAFNAEFDEVHGGKKGSKFIFRIVNRETVCRIMDTFGYEMHGAVAHHLNFGVLDEEQSRESFVRGAFLAGGSVTDPAKRYHLEFVTDHFQVSREFTALLIDMGFDPKGSSRGGNYITYFKQSAAIEDLLTTIGAPVSAMSIMSAKVEKDMMNTVNRKVNCDTANVLKAVEAAGVHLEAIKNIRGHMAFESLPDKLKQTAILREENPELPLSDLARMFEPEITKSCLNHRLRKLSEISDELNRG